MARRKNTPQPSAEPVAPAAPQPSPATQYLAQKLGIYIGNLELALAMTLEAKQAETQRADELDRKLGAASAKPLKA